MQMLQVYASELAKFNWEDDSESVLVAGKNIVGVFHSDDGADIDPRSLVGSGEAETGSVKRGSRWQFREVNPIVVKDNGGQFAFLNPAI